MKSIEIKSLKRLSPQDHLLFMQGIWAKVIEITPAQLDVEQVFHDFSEVLSELEIIVVCGNKGENIISDDDILLLARNKMDDAYLNLFREICKMDNSDLFASLDSLT